MQAYEQTTMGYLNQTVQHVLVRISCATNTPLCPYTPLSVFDLFLVFFNKMFAFLRVEINKKNKHARSAADVRTASE